MPQLISLFEHESQVIDWSERDERALRKLDQTVGAQLLHTAKCGGGRCELTATEYVGVIRLGNRTFQILPKIYRSEGEVSDDQRVSDATLNLLYMLEVAGKIKLKVRSSAPILRRRADWFEILTHLFVSDLTNQLQRGLSRDYVLLEEDLGYLKGKLRIQDQIRRPALRHVFPVFYDEFTSDNALNRVFRFVVERLLNLSREPENRRQLNMLKEWMDEVTLVPQVSLGEVNRITLSRLEARFEPILNLAKLFLSDDTMQIASGTLNAFAFVFDMNRLFETFVTNFVRRYSAEVIPQKHGDCEIRAQSRGISVSLARHRGKQAFGLRPDILIQHHDGSFPMVIDTKYKTLEPNAAPSGIESGDFYQMFAYSQRFKCPRVVLIYPQTAGMPKAIRSRYEVEGQQGVIDAATLDFKIDLNNPQGLARLKNELSLVLLGESDF